MTTSHYCTVRPQDKQILQKNGFQTNQQTAELERQACVFWQPKATTKPCFAWAYGSLPLCKEIKLLFSKNPNAHCLDKTPTHMSNAPHQHPQQPRSSIPFIMGATGFPVPTCSVPPLQVHLLTDPQTEAAPSASLTYGSKNSHQTINDNVVTTVWYRQMTETWILPECANKVQTPWVTHYLQIILVLFASMPFWVLAQAVQNTDLGMRSSFKLK